MPRVTRKRRLGVPPREIWGVVSDPYHLPRWWPRTQRVENVTGSGGPKGRKWTQVLETKDGRGIRADFRCISAATDERYVYEQLVEGTPFDGFLQSAKTEIRLAPEGPGTEVTVQIEQRLKGLSRLGGFMMRRATGRTLAEALKGLEGAISPEGNGPAEASS